MRAWLKRARARLQGKTSTQRDIWKELGVQVYEISAIELQEIVPLDEPKSCAEIDSQLPSSSEIFFH